MGKSAKGKRKARPNAKKAAQTRWKKSKKALK
jgi:hypothetical protein